VLSCLSNKFEVCDLTSVTGTGVLEVENTGGIQMKQKKENVGMEGHTV
jgi:hypothetical protein